MALTLQTMGVLVWLDPDLGNLLLGAGVLLEVGLRYKELLLDVEPDADVGDQRHCTHTGGS